MNRKNIVLGGVAVAMATILGTTAVSAHFEGNANQTRPEFPPENHAEMMEIIETKDFSAFKTHLEENNRTEMLEKITEDNFGKFIEMKELMESGDRESARAIADELGLERRGQRAGRGFHKGNFTRPVQK